RLAAASDWDTQLAVWDLETGKRLGDELPGHALPAQNLKFVSTDVLATAGDDASLRLWDIKKAQALHTIRIDNGNLDNCWIRAMDVSPDGTKLATSTLDDSVRLWDAGTGQELWRRPGHGKLGGHRALRFEPIGKSLVSWGDDLYVRRWNVTSGEKRTEARLMPAGVKLPKEPAAGADPFRAARLGTGLISADCSRLIMELGKTAYVFDIESGQELGKFPSEAHDAARVAITPDSELMLIQRWLGPQAKEHTASLIRTADGGIEREVSLPGRYGNAVAISKDGRLAAVGFGDVEPEVRVLSLPELKEIARLTGCASQAKALAFHPSGESLAISTADTSVLVWRFRRE
ncbi:MAG: WD40 repeat domain-containing protein, partial [Singulisphaera sp.]